MPDVPATEFWDALSWEQVSRYPADLIFVSVRDSASAIETLRRGQPTFAAAATLAERAT